MAILEMPSAVMGASFTPLGFLPGQTASYAKAISADGTVVVGTTGVEAFRWTSSTGMVGLGDLSADGSVVVGQKDLQEAYRWTSFDGAVSLGDLPGGIFSSVAQSASADGSVISGAGYSESGLEAFRWTSAGGTAGLGNLLGAGGRSQAYGISADGSVVVGYTTSDIGYESFRWTSGTGMVAIGDLTPGNINNVALGVSADGGVIVGASGVDAFVWTENTGAKRLVDVLAANGATGLDGWSLIEATSISADGQWIVGTGTSSAGTQAFLANISPVPVPPASLLFVCGLAVLAGARRKSTA